MSEEIPQVLNWTSRIVGHEKVRADQLLAHPLNHRRHPMKQRQVVAASISELGFVKSILVNRITGRIIDGHERAMQALGCGDGTLVDVEYVELSEEEERKALLLLDASSELATVDGEALALLVEDLTFTDETLQDFVDVLLDEDNPTEPFGKVDEGYTTKIKAPIYEPKGEKPSVGSLQDRTKTEQLCEEIREAGLAAEVESFLVAAAQRHTVYHFRNIAEFYCHATKEVQALMERSGLVIIDMESAIANGFVHMTEQLGKIADLEIEDDKNEV